MKGMVVLIGLSGPYLAIGVIPLTSPLADSLRVAKRQEDARQEEKQLAFLQEYLSEPRRVVFAQYPFVVVEGGYSLQLHAMYIPEENKVAVRNYFKTKLEENSVTAEFPPEFLDRYSSGGRRGVTYPYMKGAARSYGDAPAFVFVEDELINLEIIQRWAIRVPDYWKSKYPDYNSKKSPRL